jgi:hypothetical protein
MVSTSTQAGFRALATFTLLSTVLTAGRLAHAGTSTAGVACDYAHEATMQDANAQTVSRVRWSCSGDQRRLQANGIPDHPIGAFPNRHNPHAVSAQNVDVTFPLVPEPSDKTTNKSRSRAAMGYMLNGVKIDASTAGTCNDDGTRCPLGPSFGTLFNTWAIEALGHASFNFGVDASNAHPQPSGAYHYHGVPEGFLAKLNQGNKADRMTLIGWAIDGFPIYARYGYSAAKDPLSALKVMAGSYRIKNQPDPNRPPIAKFAMGTFTQDYVYVAGSGDLDECNGRFGLTPDFPQGIYHYYATDTYPYLQRCVKGKV